MSNGWTTLGGRNQGTTEAIPARRWYKGKDFMSRDEFEAAKRAALEGPLKRKKSLDAVCSAGKDLTKFPFLYALARCGSRTQTVHFHANTRRGESRAHAPRNTDTYIFCVFWMPVFNTRARMEHTLAHKHYKTPYVAGQDVRAKAVQTTATFKREELVRNGKLSTIIFIRDVIDKKGHEVSGYIDYGHRLKTEDFNCWLVCSVLQVSRHRNLHPLEVTGVLHGIMARFFLHIFVQMIAHAMLDLPTKTDRLYQSFLNEIAIVLTKADQLVRVRNISIGRRSCFPSHLRRLPAYSSSPQADQNYVLRARFPAFFSGWLLASLKDATPTQGLRVGFKNFPSPGLKECLYTIGSRYPTSPTTTGRRRP